MYYLLIAYFIFNYQLAFSSIYEQERNLIEIYGDLDKDKKEEKVVVTELNEVGENGKKRELSIYKKQNSDWVLLVASKSAVLESEAGGMMGDPFISKQIEIKNGVLIIYHDGGSSWKWNTTHKYRFQNNQFELIGYHSYSGKLCEYWEDFEYNLSTGKIIYSKVFESCENEEQVASKIIKETCNKKLKTLPTLKNINTIERKIITPKNKVELNY